MGAGTGTDIEHKADGSGGKSFKLSSRSLAERIIEAHGISGIIAIMVVGTVCFIAIQQTMRAADVKIPEYFTEISTLIIGYYFGRHTAKPGDGQQ